jgi:hypothetical protein
MKLTSDHHLVPTVGLSGAKPQLPIDVFMAWTGKALYFLLVLFMFGFTRLCELGFM